MSLSDGAIRRPRSRCAGRGGPRRPTGWKPVAEPLDARRLPSTAAPAAIVLPTPPAAAVAQAAAFLDGLTPLAFANFQSVLASAAAHSQVTQAQVDRLASDESAIDQGIESSGLIPQIQQQDMDQVQDLVDMAFIEKTESSIKWIGQMEQLEQCTGGTQVRIRLLNQTIEQMYAVARAAGVPSGTYATLQTDMAHFEKREGPDPAITFGPGVPSGDPVVVYYDGQVGNFVR
jgi:hypothetical protein